MASWLRIVARAARRGIGLAELRHLLVYGPVLLNDLAAAEGANPSVLRMRRRRAELAVVDACLLRSGPSKS